ncbi:hypothetical protein [Microbispora sp. ATCC PTA-5024]|uniref:hypothetical protein n=1 Tax=Microbispora sp. ATCC PTA-5024 TaxID=316330 RepID=UPI0012EEAA4A|nr:hypothetical protein [Microbispora sp. ATCC PTA-5024]
MGTALAMELVNAFGPRRGLMALDSTVHNAFTEHELGILAAAAARILAQREAAPDDLSSLPHVDMEGCSDAECLICWGAES